MHRIDYKHYFMTFLKSNYLLVIVFIINITLIQAQCNINFNTIPTIGEGCDVLGVQFNSTITGTTLGTPAWDFGDGSAKFSGKNPFHNYTTKANDTSYSVTLSVTCLDGSTATKKANVAVFAKPKAGFELSTLEICTFSDVLKPINSSSRGNGIAYKWDFGDNSVSNDLSPSHVYSQPGTYDVLLEVTNAKGCKDKIQKSIVAKPAPNAEFDMDQFMGCQPLAVMVTNTTQNDATFQTTSFEWSTSDGEKIGNSSPATFKFADAGIHEIFLKVTNSLGCSNTTSVNVLVKQTPSIVSTTIPITPICYDTPLSISIQTNPAASTVVWKPSNGIVIVDSLSKSPQLSFENGGAQRVDAKLSYNGCVRDTFFVFNVVPKPLLSLDYEPKVLCEGAPITVTASPADLSSYVFENNNIRLSSNAHIATIKRAFIFNRVVLDAIDNSGCRLSSTIDITAKDKPSIALKSNAVKDTICMNQPLDLIASPLGLDSYRFIINGVEQQTGAGHTYSIPNANQPVDVRLIADKNGCSDTTNLQTIRLKLPSGAPNINCVESGFDFITYGFDQIKGNNTYEISINQGAFSPISSTSGTYVLKQLTANTEYTAQLRVKLGNQSPCDSMVFSDVATCKTIPCEKLDFTLAPLVSAFCESGNASLDIDNIISPSGNYNIYWNGVKSTSTSFDQSDLSVAGSPYTVTVAVEDPSRSEGCKVIQKKALVYVDKKPDTTGFLYTYAVDDLCKPKPYLLLNVMDPNPTYHYTFKNNDGKSSPGTINVNLPYESPASQVILEIESPNQACKALVVKDVQPRDMDDVVALEIDSLLSTLYDSTTCGEPWIYHFHTGFDTIKLKALKQYLPNFTDFNITRFTTYKGADPTKNAIATLAAAEVPNTFVFSQGLIPLDNYSFKDSVTFLNENGCPIAYSWGNPVTVDRPASCDTATYLYCSNRKDTISIRNMEAFRNCLGFISGGTNYFSGKPSGYTLVDPYIVVRNLDTSSTKLYIKNKKYGCFKDSIKVCSFYCDTSLYIPNAMTPNGDLKNDKWEIKFAHGKVAVRIYNRWEQLVFSSDDYRNNFEGVSDDGVLLPDGVYFYELQINGSSHLEDQEFGRNAKTLDDILNREYSVGLYKCDSKSYKMMKGKLLIQR